MSLLALRAILNQQGAGAWSPLDLPDLEGWWDASDDGSFTYSSGTRVSQWSDLSGNSRHLVNSTAGTQPTRSATVNGLDAIDFDRTRGDFLATTEFTLAQPLWVWYVLDPETSPSDMFHYDSATSSNSRFGFFNGNTRFTVDDVGSFRTITATDSAALHQYLHVLNGASSSARRDKSAFGSTGDLGAGSFKPLTVMARFSKSNALTGTLCEFAMGTGTLSTDDRDLLEQYAVDKWATP